MLTLSQRRKGATGAVGKRALQSGATPTPVVSTSRRAPWHQQRRSTVLQFAEDSAQPLRAPREDGDAQDDELQAAESTLHASPWRYGALSLLTKARRQINAPGRAISSRLHAEAHLNGRPWEITGQTDDEGLPGRSQ